MGEAKDKAKGRVKEIIGSATDNPRMRREGRHEVRRGRLKGAAKEIKGLLDE